MTRTKPFQRWYDARHETTLHLLALSTRAKVEILRGDLGDASRSLSTAEALLKAGVAIPPYYEVAYWTARLRLGVALIEELRAKGRSIPTGMRFRTRAVCKRAVALSRKVARERSECFGLAARLASLLGHQRTAASYWESALEEARQLDVRPESARICLSIGRWLEKSGVPGSTFQDVDAEGWVSRARSDFENLGLTWEAENIERA